MAKREKEERESVCVCVRDCTKCCVCVSERVGSVCVCVCGRIF